MHEANSLKHRSSDYLNVFFWVLIVSSATALFAQDSEMKKIPDVGGYVKNQGNSRVLVFLHGIYSGREAWRCDEDHYWPAMIKADKDSVFSDTDIYVAIYSAPTQGNKMDLLDIETQLVNRLDNDNVFSSHKEVIFVAHSMGGILIQEVLLTYSDQKYMDKVHYLFLYGTPLEGSKWASIGKLFKSDPHLNELKSGDNFVLSDLDQRWIHKGQEIQRYCSYEVEKEGIAKIVSRQSATRGCSDRNAIRGTHREIVKPCSNTDDAYTYLKRKLKEIRNSAPLPGTATSASGVATLADPAAQARNQYPPIVGVYEQTAGALGSLQGLRTFWEEATRQIEMERVSPYKHRLLTGPMPATLPEPLAERLRTLDETFSARFIEIKPSLINARRSALNCLNFVPNELNADSNEFDNANAVALKRLSLQEIQYDRPGDARSRQLEQYFSSLHYKVGSYHCVNTK